MTKATLQPFDGEVKICIYCRESERCEGGEWQEGGGGG